MSKIQPCTFPLFRFVTDFCPKIPHLKIVCLLTELAITSTQCRKGFLNIIFDLSFPVLCWTLSKPLLFHSIMLCGQTIKGKANGRCAYKCSSHSHTHTHTHMHTHIHTHIHTHTHTHIHTHTHTLHTLSLFPTTKYLTICPCVGGSK